MTTQTAAPPPAKFGPRAADPWFYGWRYVTRPGPDGKPVWEQVPLTAEDVLHPQEDDFIVTTDAHDTIRDYLKHVFRWRLSARPGALVLCDHRVDWQVPGIRAHGPDLTVLFDARTWDPHRGTYPVRDEGATPALVVEVTSPSTRENDLDKKVMHYCLAGIPQYLIVDFRETDNGWQVVFLAYRPSPEGPVRQILQEPNRVWLPALDLWVAAEGDQVVCLLPDGSPIGDFTEVMREAEEAERRADEEHQRAVAAEQLAAAEQARAEAEKARADAERRQAEAERERADAERLRADAERQQAEKERQRADALEAELRRLRGDNP